MAAILTLPTAGSYEFLSWASALLSALSDVCGAEGQAFNFALPLFALYSLWTRNPRGVMFTQAFFALTLILDVVFCAVFAPTRPPSAIGFVATNMFAKAGLLFFGHFLLTEMGGSYSVATPTSEATRRGGPGFIAGSPAAVLVHSQPGTAAITHEVSSPSGLPAAHGGYQAPEGAQAPSFSLKIEGDAPGGGSGAYQSYQG